MSKIESAAGGEVQGFAGDLSTAAAAEQPFAAATTGAALRVDGGVVKSAF